MPVINAHFKPITKTVKVPLTRNRTRYVKLAIGYTDECVPQDAVRSAPANFVHSLDAAHLHLIALAAAAEKIPLVAVHDSFATIATRAKRLKEIIPDQFIALHERDWLNAARESAIPPKADIFYLITPKLPHIRMLAMIPGALRWVGGLGSRRCPQGGTRENENLSGLQR
jgi:hypothetical protein